MSKAPPLRLSRAFADTAHGRIHYRYHLPGSARGTFADAARVAHVLVGACAHLAARLGETLNVVCPDTPGNGDSDPLPMEQPRIEDFASSMIALLDTLGMEHAAVYGSHTGRPHLHRTRHRRTGTNPEVVLDGIALFEGEERQDMLRNYAPEIHPDLEGRHLVWAFQFMRDQNIFFPRFKRDPEHLRGTGLVAPRVAARCDAGGPQGAEHLPQGLSRGFLAPCARSGCRY